MTAEEIEIIVTAKIESALKEFQKLVPAIKESIKQTQEAMSKINTDAMSNKVSKAVQLVKNKIQELKKSSANNEIAIKVNNKDAQKQITQIQKQIDSLQEKINARQMKLNLINPQIDKIVDDTRNSVVPDGISKNDKSMDTVVNNALSSNKDFTSLNSQAQKLYTEIEMYNKQLSEAKSKMAELGQQTSQTATTQSKLGSFFSSFKQKIEQVKSSSKGLQSSFSKLPKITQNITNNIKGMGTGLKQGLGHVMKYAMALFSLRGIYSVLSSCASTWLSSQNAGAKQLSANIDYMKYAMGSALAPVIQFVTNLVYQLMKAIQSVAYALTGVNIFAKASANSYASMAGNAKKAKNETKQLEGVHNEINNISDNNSDSGSGTTNPSFDLSQMDNTPNSIIDAIKNGNWYEVGATIGQKLNDAMNKIPWDKIQNTAKKIGTGIAQTLNGFIATTDWNQVGNTVAQGINTAIYFAQSFVKTFDFSNFGKSIGTSLSSLIRNIDWKALGDTLSSGIKGIFDTISGFFETFDWSVVINGLFDFISGFDWNGVSDAIFKALGSACASLVNLGMVIGEKINQALDSAKKYFQEKIEECGGNVVAGIFKGIGDAIAGIGQWINDHIFQPFIEGFKNVFGIHSPSTVMEEQGNFIIQGLLNGISNLVGKVTEIWNNMKTTVVEIFTNIKTKIKEKVSEIKNNVSQKFQEVCDNTTNIFTNIKNKASEIWTNIKTNISNKITDIKNGISQKFQEAYNSITRIFSNIGNFFSNIWRKS